MRYQLKILFAVVLTAFISFSNSGATENVSQGDTTLTLAVAPLQILRSEFELPSGEENERNQSSFP